MRVCHRFLDRRDTTLEEKTSMSEAASDSLMSPRLRRLQAALSQGTGQALAEFWQEVSAQGTPLIEPLADDQRRRLVTFLWRAVEETHAVTISSSLTGTLGGWPFNQHRFARLAGTDLWYRSYRVPSDTRTTYQLGPNDP
jgi:enterochelin esterase family protein